MTATPAQTLDGGDCPHESLVASPSPAGVAALLSLLAAAWLAAGSAGLWGAIFLRALGFTALVAAVVLLPPAKKHLVALLVMIAFWLVLPLFLSCAAIPPGCDVLVIAAAAAVLAASRQGVERSAMATAAWAAAALGLFRLASDFIPAFWHFADSVGRGMGDLVGVVCSRPLWIGSSFAGLDFLVLMAAFYAAWLAATPAPRRRRAIFAAVVIAAVQISYLLVLAQSEYLLELLPEIPPPPSADPTEYAPPAWSLAAALRGMIPWCLPALAMSGYLLVAAAMMRWTDWGTRESQTQHAEAPAENSRLSIRPFLPVLLLSALAAFAMTFAPSRGDLSGKKIVAYADFDSAWILPEHGAVDLMAADGYGMLQPFVASLGGKFAISQSLSQADLQDADALMMIDPQKPLAEDALRRVHDFVNGGGSLLLIAGPAGEENFDRRAVDEILQPCGMSVRFDRAEPAVPHWREGLQAPSHPAALGVDQRRNQFGLNLSSSVGAGEENYRRSAGRPLLVGRWGWCESGGDMAAGGMGAYNAGERLGDVVLAAEKPLGRGTVVVLGDTTGLANIGLTYTHPFAARLLGYLAHGGGNPQNVWRQLIAVVLVLTLVWLVFRQTLADKQPVATTSETPARARMNRLAAAAFTAAVCTAVSLAIGGQLNDSIPDGNLPGARPIAYFAAAHYGIAGDDPWTPRGMGGFAVTLMRNGYMPLMLYDFEQQRLVHAAMLAVVGPTREFSQSERDFVGRFVEGGGLLVCAIGAEHSAANKQLLADFAFTVPHSPVGPGDTATEPAPSGRFPEDFGRALLPYLDAKSHNRGDYVCSVQFHRPWPIGCSGGESNQDVLVRGYDGCALAIAVHRGNGQAVVFGDSHFMLNENHSYVDGRPGAVTAANLDFWRFILGRVTGIHDWFPPDRAAAAENVENENAKESEKTPDAKQGEEPRKTPEELPEPALPFNPLRPEEVQ